MIGSGDLSGRVEGRDPAARPSSETHQRERQNAFVPSSFVHLHQHTEYSMLDGASRIGEVVAAAVRDGQPALGITDHGNMYGVLDFYKECRAQDIKPIIGSELYMAYEDRTERFQQLIIQLSLLTTLGQWCILMQQPHEHHARRHITHPPPTSTTLKSTESRASPRPISSS